MNPREKVDGLLKSIGAVLKRRKKHEVWQLPDGGMFTRACTPSDIRADNNNLSDLKRAAGILDPERGNPGQRRDRRNKPGRHESEMKITPAPPRSEFALRLAYVQAMEDLERLRAEVVGLMASTDYWKAVANTPCPCWWCRARRRMTGHGAR